MIKIERIESLKAGFLGGFTFIITDIIVKLINQNCLLIKFQNLTIFFSPIDAQLLWKMPLVAGFTGFLFGVTYRYIVRNDQNSHLKDGAVLAFALTRSLLWLEKLNHLDFVSLTPYFLLIIESVFCFLVTRLALDLALFYQWLNPFEIKD